MKMSNLDKSLDDIIRSKPNRNTRTKARKTPYNKKGGNGNSNGRSVYVGNLSYKTDWMQLKDVMSEAGEVEYVDLFTRKGDGKSCGCAVVEFKTAEDAQNAIKTLHDRNVDGRPIFLREDREPRRANVGGGGGPGAGGPGNFGRGGGGGGPGRGNRSWDEPVHSSHSNMAYKIRKNAQPNTTVKITNIPPSAEWQELKDLCVQYATVERADVEEVNGERYGIVVFSNADGASKCLAELDGATYEEHTLGASLVSVATANFGGGNFGGRSKLASRLTPRGPRGGYRSHGGAVSVDKVFIGNLPWNVEWQDLKDLCKEYGPVAFVDIPKNENGQSKGFGIVRYDEPAGASECINKLNGMLLDGRELEVRFDQRGGR